MFPWNSRSRMHAVIDCLVQHIEGDVVTEASSPKINGVIHN